MRVHEIEEHQIFYVSKKGKIYCKESSEFVQEFFYAYADEVEWAKCTIFHDEGAAFRDGEHSIFNRLEYVVCAQEVVYPPPVHQFLSVNDNKAHGIAKAEWRSSRISRKDHLEVSLFLLARLGDLEQTSMMKMWDENFLWNNFRPSREECKSILTNGDFHKLRIDKFHSSCLQEYETYVGRYPSRRLSVQPAPPVMFRDSLDGTYWNEWT